MIRLILLAAILATTTSAHAQPPTTLSDGMSIEAFLELGKRGLKELQDKEAKERERAPQQCPRPDFRDWSRGPYKGSV